MKNIQRNCSKILQVLSAGIIDLMHLPVVPMLTISTLAKPAIPDSR
jgi:hypothetical protein